MKGPISVRLGERERATIEAEARARGLGISAFVRDILEDEARRLHREQIREEGRRLVERLSADEQLAAEYDDADLLAGEVIP
jgi:post-segregation antitoxin (ccd killing protein)